MAGAAWPTIVGFTILGELGHGGMGRVYLARQNSLNRIVALKVLSNVSGIDDALVQRFLREAEAASLHHRAIVPIYDFGGSGGHLYLAMAVMEGGSLRQRLAKGPLTPPQAVHVSSSVAAALAHAHMRKVVHRDVKPSNILFDRDGNAYLSDFGIARLSGNSGLTSTSDIIGTVEYVAPELTTGAQATPSSDVYALSATLHESLTGRPPFVGENPFAVLLQHREDPPPPLPPSVPEPLAALINAGLAKKPADRPSELEHFSERLLGLSADRVDVEVAGLPVDLESDPSNHPTSAPQRPAERGPASFPSEAEEPRPYRPDQSWYGERPTTGPGRRPKGDEPIVVPPGELDARGGRRRATALIVAATILAVAMIAAALLLRPLSRESVQDASASPSTTADVGPKGGSDDVAVQDPSPSGAALDPSRVQDPILSPAVTLPPEVPVAPAPGGPEGSPTSVEDPAPTGVAPTSAATTRAGPTPTVSAPVPTALPSAPATTAATTTNAPAPAPAPAPTPAPTPAPAPAPPPPTIFLARGGGAPSGYWYSVSLSNFTPGSSVTLTCRDSVDPQGFWNQTFTINGAGQAGDSTLCYSGDHPDHWVTGGGYESNHVTW